MGCRVHHDIEKDLFTVLSTNTDTILMLEGTRKEFIKFMANRAAKRERRSWEYELEQESKSVKASCFDGENLRELLETHIPGNSNEEMNKAVKARLKK